MTTLNYISLSLDFFSILITLIIFLCLFLEAKRQTRLNHLFRYVALSNIGFLFSDALAWLMQENQEWYAYYLVRVANYFHYVFGALVLAAITIYLIAYLESKDGKMRKIARVVLLLCVASVLLTTISLFTNMYYFIDENNVYHRQNWFWLSQLFPIVGLIINISIVSINIHILKPRALIFALAYLALPLLAMTIQLFFYGITYITLGTTLTVLIIYIGIQAEQAKDMEKELTQSKLSVMLSQIQPHSLYNTLTTIENFCYKDGVRAAKMVRDFAGYLRENMDSLEQKRPVPFRREMAHTQIYLELEKCRFEERLNVVYDFAVTDFSLPILTIQPLVENAVRHGVAKSLTGCTVTILTRQATDGVMVIISDNGMGFDPDQVPTDGRSHIGITNVRERLRTQCGGTLTVESAKGKGTVCTIFIPSL